MSNFVTVDGNEAAAYVAYEFSEIAAIYPISPSSPMAGFTDKWSAQGRENMFGQRVKLTEMQSEAGAIGAMHGSLEAGAYTTSFTSSQGLMLMIPTMYRIAGERLPGVLHVASRTVGTHALSIFGDHSDVMAVRDTGFALLSSGSVQEAADLASVAHLSAIKASIPFLHFFDGYRTSHELSRIDMPDVKELAKLADTQAIEQFRAHALNPEHPQMRAMVQNADVFFQIREANNTAYEDLPAIVEDVMKQVGQVTGRTYHAFNYYGAEDATDVIVAMGSVSGTVQEAVDYLNDRAEAAGESRRYGFVQVHLYRPFSPDLMLKALPESVERIAVLDRCKNMGGAGEPLYKDVASAVAASDRANRTVVIGGRYGLSSRDTDTAQMVAVFENLGAAEPIVDFSVGITDDVTNKSLPVKPLTDLDLGDVYACKFWGLGGDGTVGANKNTIKILAENQGLMAQAYFEFDTKKSYGVTKSHLRLSKNPIRSTYFVKSADFVACHNQAYMQKYDVVQEVKPGGMFLLNTQWTAEQLNEKLPGQVKSYLANNNIRMFVIDAVEIALRLGLGSHTNTVLQAAFFQVSGVMDPTEALEAMKDAVRKTYAKKGDAVIAKNVAAIDEGAANVHEFTVPAEWATAEPAPEPDFSDLPRGIREFLMPAALLKADDLPVSTFLGFEDGTFDNGFTKYEKRGIAVKTPAWDAETCIQCNRCSYVCPHAAIRPFLLTDEEAAQAPAGFTTVPAKGKKAEGLQYTVQVSTFDCTGCGSCAAVCPSNSLTMEPARLTDEALAEWNYAMEISDKGDLFDPYTVKGSQFRQPLFEFSAACAGCGETPYAKLLTQLFGDRVYWANATGCTQAWGSGEPGIPYTVNKRGHGPAWTNSLFENNAELSYGMYLASTQQREAEKARVIALMEASDVTPQVRELCEKWLAEYDSFEGSRVASDNLIAALAELTGADCGTPVVPFKDAAHEALAGKNIFGGAKPQLGESADYVGAKPLFGESADSQALESTVDDALVSDPTHEGSKRAISQADEVTYQNLDTEGAATTAAAIAREILQYQDQLAKKTFWMFGGDGWAYDIGFGGLDHVLSTGGNFNVLVVDTEVYSNTGGQSSKATPAGAVAEFAASGKKTAKKDLGAILMSYGNVYVAQVSMGADYNQLVKALKEAEEYDGPAVIIAYAPCTSHGLRCGMADVQGEMKRATESGYWPLYRYNPDKEHPMQLDSKDPTMDYLEYLEGENRFASLKKAFPDEAERLFEESKEDALRRLERYKELASE